MNNKKVLVLLGAIAIVVIAVVVFVLVSKPEKQAVLPPPVDNPNNATTAVLSEDWELYQSDAAKYGISLPKAWFVDQDSLIGGGAQLVVSNKPTLEPDVPGIVAVEVFPKITKKSSETLFAAIKAKGKSGGDFGATKAGATDTGYEMFVVEHAYGNPADGPGYAIARSKTEYMYIVATSNQEQEIVDGMVTSVVFIK